MQLFHRIILIAVVAWFPSVTVANAQSCAQICQQYLNYARGAGAPGTYGPLVQLYNQCISCRRSGGTTYQQRPQPQSRCPAGSYSSGNRCVSDGHYLCPNGKIQCSLDKKCSSSGCIPQDATDCGGTSYCSDGRICWRSPSGVQGFTAGKILCATQEEADELDRSVEKKRTKARAEADERRNARLKEKKLKREAFRRAALKRRKANLRKKRDDVISTRKGIERDRRKSETRLIKEGHARRRESLYRLDKKIMRDVRRNSILDKLNGVPNSHTSLGLKKRDNAEIGTSVSSSMPKYVTPAPGRNVPVLKKELRTLPSRKLAEPKKGFSYATPGSGTSAVQDWVAGKSIPSGKISPQAQEAARKHREKTETLLEMDKIDQDVKRRQEKAYLDKAPSLAPIDKLVRKPKKKRYTDWRDTVVGTKKVEAKGYDLINKCRDVATLYTTGRQPKPRPKVKICDLFQKCRMNLDTFKRACIGPKRTVCEGKKWEPCSGE